MNTKRVDDLIEATLFPGEDEGEGFNPTRPRFNWPPKRTPKRGLPGTHGPSGIDPRGTPPPGDCVGGECPPTEDCIGGECLPGEEPMDDEHGELSLNQILGRHRIASAGDFDNAPHDDMRGAELGRDDYRRMEFESAQRIVDALLEGKAESDLKKLEKGVAGTVKKTNKSVSKWMRDLGKKKK